MMNQTLVIKVGTSTLTRKNKNGRYELDAESFARIATQIIHLKNRGYGIALVSSAAITAGVIQTGLLKRPPSNEALMPTLQGLASIGWRHVLNQWAEAFGGHLAIGELLITRHDLSLDSELLRVSQNLIVNGHMPIINENDSVTHEQIAFGDNDTLAATYAARLQESGLFGSSVSLIILSDIDGVYEDVGDQTTLIRTIENIDTMQHVIVGTGSDVGTGGMQTKFAAARIARASGVAMYIANGRLQNVLERTMAGETGTHFMCYSDS